jgi:hypothetical protein
MLFSFLFLYIAKVEMYFFSLAQHIPSSFAQKYLNRVSGLVTLQISDGQRWLVRCINEGNGAKLSQGWREFVLDNCLEEGDVCVFELINMEDIVLKVTIFRVLEDAGLGN